MDRSQTVGSVFSNFKFQIGDIVRHRTGRMAYVVIARSIFESITGIEPTYSITSPDHAMPFALEIELQSNELYNPPRM